MKERLSFLFIGTDNDSDGLSEVLARVHLEAVRGRYKVGSQILCESNDLLPVEIILDFEPNVILAILPIEIKSMRSVHLIEALDSNYGIFSKELLAHLQNLKIQLFWLAPLSWNLEILKGDEHWTLLRESVKDYLGYFPVVFSSEKPSGILKKMIEAAEVIRTR